MNIHQKLIEVRKSVPYLKKDNEGHQFQYVSSSQTLGNVRAAMDEHGLLLVPSVIDKEVSDHTTKNGNHEYFTQIAITFTWVNADNPEEKIECAWLGQGLDSGEKGVGKALTYAEKYFILKFFNIPTDKDDPDSFQGKAERSRPSPPQPKRTSSDWIEIFDKENCTTVAGIKAWRSANGEVIRQTISSAQEATKLKGYLDDMEKEYSQPEGAK